MNRKEYLIKEIHKEIKSLGLTYNQVSIITGIDETSIREIELGISNLPICKLETALNSIKARSCSNNLINFLDLTWDKHPFHILADQMGESYPNYKKNKTCYQSKCLFSNGLQRSVVVGEYFKSNGIDTYEVCFYSKDGFQRIYGHQTKSRVNILMEYAQNIKDIKLLDLLCKEEFESIGDMFSYIKKIGDWWIIVEPVGQSYFSYNKEPANFETMIFCNYKMFKDILPEINKFIEEKESR